MGLLRVGRATIATIRQQVLVFWLSKHSLTGKFCDGESRADSPREAGSL